MFIVKTNLFEKKWIPITQNYHLMYSGKMAMSNYYIETVFPIDWIFKNAINNSYK